MKVYTRKIKCSQAFPREIGQRWNVKEHGKVVEAWEVVKVYGDGLLVEIVEFLEPDYQYE